MSGFCVAKPTGERTCETVRGYADASGCVKFSPLTRVVTDGSQSGHMGDHHIRRYGQYDLKEIDVKVDPEKLRDEKYWG